MTEAYVVVELPGRGLGVVASRPLHRGDVLVAESPLVRLTPNLGRPDVKWFDDERHARSLLAGLSRSAGNPTKWKWWDKDLDAVVNTNSFTQESGGMVHSYVFNQVSRFNHSCCANARMIFDGDRELATVRVQRDVAPGTEITINYGATGSLSERQQHLRTCFGFTCTCELCAREATAAKAG